MNWHDINVFQFQQLSELELSGKETIDLMAETCAICYNMTEHEVDSLSMQDFNKKCEALAFLNTPPIWEPAKHVTVNDRRYRFVYDVRNIHASRYMEVKQFSGGGIIPGLHKMAASMVIPQRKNWLGQWMDEVYDASKHAEYASDMQAAPITAIHGSAVFFCKVFTNSIGATVDYLTSTIPASQREAAKQSLLDSCRLLAGSITPPSLLNTNVSHLSRRIASRLSNS